MYPLCTAQEMQALDRHAIEEIGIPSIVLMENAGRAITEAIIDSFIGPIEEAHVVVICGGGNNGGDGFVIARVLHDYGASVQILLIADPQNLSPDTTRNYTIATQLKVPVAAVQSEAEVDDLESVFQNADVIVDALFGTGLGRDIEGIHGAIVEQINQSPGLIVAVDIPSGIDATTGHVLGTAVTADLTVTLGALKWGIVLSHGSQLAGEVDICDIGIPTHSEECNPPTGWVAEDEDVFEALPDRPEDAHKGTFGHVLVLAGSQGHTGAAALAGAAALRSGAGLVTVGADEPTLAGLAESLPEAMTAPVRIGSGPEAALDLEALAPYLSRATSLVIGPGLGQGDALRESLITLLQQTDLPIVLDADALRLLENGHEALIGRTGATILTPHPGEMAGLLGITTEEVQQDRRILAAQVAQQSDSVVVLKGSGTITASPAGELRWNPTGGPAMATAGSGDVLAGCIGSLLAQGVGPFEAAWAGAYIHGRAGDVASETRGDAGIIASDIAHALPTARLSLTKEEEPQGDGEDDQ